MEKQIIVIKSGSLKPEDKEKLTKAGNIVVEHEKYFEIYFKSFPENNDHYDFVNCASCGDRIYLLSERLASLQKGYESFYCSRMHKNFYPKDEKQK